jgi:hypothetical protein
MPMPGRKLTVASIPSQTSISFRAREYQLLTSVDPCGSIRLGFRLDGREDAQALNAAVGGGYYLHPEADWF